MKHPLEKVPHFIGPKPAGVSEAHYRYGVMIVAVAAYARKGESIPLPVARQFQAAQAAFDAERAGGAK